MRSLQTHFKFESPESLDAQTAPMQSALPTAEVSLTGPVLPASSRWGKVWTAAVWQHLSLLRSLSEDNRDVTKCMQPQDVWMGFNARALCHSQKIWCIDWRLHLPVCVCVCVCPHITYIPSTIILILPPNTASFKFTGPHNLEGLYEGLR